MIASEREDLLRQAEKLVSRGRIEGAILQYRKVLKELPNDTTLLNLVGDLYARVDRTSEAIEQYERTADRFASEGFFVKAIAVLKKVHRLDGSRYDLYERLGDLYRRQGLLKESVGQYLSLAKQYMRQEKKVEAITVYQRIVEIEPQGLEHRLQLAQLYEEQGQLNLVANEYRDIARFLLAHDRVEEATKVLHSGLLVDPTNERYIREALSLLRQTGRSDVAAELLEEAEKLNPDLGDLSLTDGDLSPEELATDFAGASAGAQPEGVAATGNAGMDPASSRRPSSEADELLAEAQVFVKYGLQQKALDRLEEVLQIAPNNLSAHGQLIALLIEQEKYDRVKSFAKRMALTARERGDLLPWTDMRQKLRDAGFELEGDEIVAGPSDAGPAVATEDGQRERTSGPGLQSVDPLEALLTDDSSDFASLIATDSPDNIELLGAEDDAASGADDRAPGAATEKTVPDPAGDPLADEVGEESVREIVEHFTAGVSEHLSPEDSDTHYNLGVAFREMGLLDEAVGEFEIAAQSPQHALACYSLLSECLRGSGQVDRAIDWCQTGLAEPGLNTQQQLAFLYELGECHVMSGDSKSAYETFSQIHGLEPEYRDVVDRLAELGN